MNMGYFNVSNDAEITFILDTMTVNDKYVFDMAVELTNTREWADGLKNIWNGFSNGDKVYSSDYAEFVYSDDAIVFFAGKIPSSADASSAPLVDCDLTFLASVKGTGRIEARLDSPTGQLLSYVDFDSPDAFSAIYNNDVAPIGGTHDIYFVFSDQDIEFESWAFAKASADGSFGDIDSNRIVDAQDVLLLKRHLHGKRALNSANLGDLNFDGTVNVADLAVLKKSLIG